LITVNDILAGHVSLDVACLDRILADDHAIGLAEIAADHRRLPAPAVGATTCSLCLCS
jgi:hypothetical protein